MKILIHDLNEQELSNLLPEISDNVTVISNEHEIHKCIGCFGCWIKTPATCVIKDAYKDTGKLISKCDELIIISRCCYGGFSPFVKNVLDRSISYLLPYFIIKNSEMHHKNRYDEQIKFTAKFYGDSISQDEKNTATELVRANGLNFNAKEHSVSFYKDLKDMRGEAL